MTDLLSMIDSITSQRQLTDEKVKRKQELKEQTV